MKLGHIRATIGIKIHFILNILFPISTEVNTCRECHSGYVGQSFAYPDKFIRSDRDKMKDPVTYKNNSTVYKHFQCYNCDYRAYYKETRLKHDPSHSIRKNRRKK